MERIEFIESISNDVIEACNRWGLFPSIAIAQLCLESTYGTSELAVNANNIAGKKWTKNRFEPYYKVTKEYLTCTREEAEAQGFEFIEEGLYKKSLAFNYYSSWKECIEHYCENLMTAKWYAGAREYLYDRKEFLREMSKVYAPNHPTYAEDVERVIIQYELTKYDLE